MLILHCPRTSVQIDAEEKWIVLLVMYSVRYEHVDMYMDGMQINWMTMIISKSYSYLPEYDYEHCCRTCALKLYIHGKLNGLQSDMSEAYRTQFLFS